MKPLKLANVILLASISSASLASGPDLTEPSATSEPLTESQTELSSDSTYWGVGIGSVLGGVLAGPPGIAIGATLGGVFGWGQDQSDALAHTQQVLDKKEALMGERSLTLNQQAERLKVVSAQIGELKKTQQRHQEQVRVLKAELADKEKMLSQSDLSNLLSTYTQEIYFEKGRARLPEYAESRISDLAVFLKRYPDLQVRLIGYTDQSGPAAFNEQLSQARAVGVRDALHEQGVALERMIIESLGESMAKVEKGDQGNAILDRRVAIHLDQGVADELLSNQEEIVESVESIVDTALAEWMN